MTISVCMATFNGAPFVARQLSSILAQTRTPDEIVIVDDASTDSTVAQIRSFNEPRIQLAQHGANRGTTATFLDAMATARGDFLFFSDQDDRWMPEKIEKVMERFAAGADVVVHDAVIVANGEVIAPSLFAVRRPSPKPWTNFVSNTYTGCCMAFRRSILGDVLPMPLWRGVGHDGWTGMAGSIAGWRTEYIERPLIEFTRHGGNASAGTRRALPIVLADRLVLGVAVARLLLRRIACRRPVRIT